MLRDLQEIEGTQWSRSFERVLIQRATRGTSASEYGQAFAHQQTERGFSCTQSWT